MLASRKERDGLGHEPLGGCALRRCRGPQRAAIKAKRLDITHVLNVRVRCMQLKGAAYPPEIVCRGRSRFHGSRFVVGVAAVAIGVVVEVVVDEPEREDHVLRL